MTNGIGGVGGGGTINPNMGIPPVTSTLPANSPETSFRTTLEQASQVNQADAVQSKSPLERLRSQDIDFDQYIDLKVKEATKSLESLLPPNEIQFIQDELRDVIAQDPDIASMANRAQMG